MLHLDKWPRVSSDNQHSQHYWLVASPGVDAQRSAEDARARGELGKNDDGPDAGALPLLCVWCVCVIKGCTRCRRRLGNPYVRFRLHNNALSVVVESVDYEEQRAVGSEV